MFMESKAGLLAGRFLKAQALSANDPERARGFIAGQPGWKSEHRSLMEAASLQRRLVDIEVKAAVGAATLGSTGFSRTDVGLSWFAAIRQYSALAAMTQARTAPINSNLRLFGTPAAAYSGLAEGAPVPVVKSNFAMASRFAPTKSMGLTVVTKDILRFASDGTEDRLTADLAAAVATAEDGAFLTPSTTGSILHSVTSVASTGSSLAAIDADLKSAMAVLIAAGSTLQSAVWIVSPTTATSLSLIRGSGGENAYPTVNVRGGTLAGLPVVVTAGVSGFIALVDQAGLLLDQDPQVSLDSSEEAAIEQVDAPTNNSVTPTAVQLVPMFQTDSVALRVVQFRAWQLVRAGFATFISGVTY